VGSARNRLRTVLLFASLSMVHAGAAHALSFDQDCGGQTDVDTATATLVGCTISQAGTITDLTVVIEIDDPGAAPYVSDLELILSDDSTGDSVILYTGAQPVTPEARMVATFDDAAGSLAPTSNNVLGTFLPVQARSLFDDNELSGDSGRCPSRISRRGPTRAST
jgi:hypothetical protein